MQTQAAGGRTMEGVRDTAIRALGRGVSSRAGSNGSSGASGGSPATEGARADDGTATGCLRAARGVGSMGRMMTVGRAAAGHSVARDSGTWPHTAGRCTPCAPRARVPYQLGGTLKMASSVLRSQS